MGPLFVPTTGGLTRGVPQGPTQTPDDAESSPPGVRMGRPVAGDPRSPERAERVEVPGVDSKVPLGSDDYAGLRGVHHPVSLHMGYL